MRTILLATLLAGCAAQRPADVAPTTSDTPVAVRTGTLTPSTPAPEPAVAPSPEAARWAPLAERLRARHAADLPDRAALLAIPDAAEGLAWLASNDPTMLVRARALDAIGRLGAPGATATLRGVLDDASAHPKLRAAAVIGLGRLGDDADATKALVGAVADPDLRVATEAVDVLAARPATWPALKEAAKGPTVLPEIRDRVDGLR